MSELEQVFCDADQFMNDIKLPHFIHGSTLLGLIRNKRILNRDIEAMLPVDKEHNFGCYYEDLTSEMLDKIRLKYPFVRTLNGHWTNTLIFFGEKPVRNAVTEKEDNVWDIPIGFNLLACFHKGKSLVVEDMAENRALTWPKGYLDHPRFWGEIEVFGRTIKTPRKTMEWLDHYFGTDWVVERKHWHWSQDSHNLEKMSDLIKRGEVS